MTKPHPEEKLKALRVYSRQEYIEGNRKHGLADFQAFFEQDRDGTRDEYYLIPNLSAVVKRAVELAWIAAGHNPAYYSAVSPVTSKDEIAAMCVAEFTNKEKA